MEGKHEQRTKEKAGNRKVHTMRRLRLNGDLPVYRLHSRGGKLRAKLFHVRQRVRLRRGNMTKYEIWIQHSGKSRWKHYTTFEMKEPALDYLEILRSYGIACFMIEA